MITKVYGSCNSISVTFTLNDRGRWETVYPIEQSGRYILELYAEDEAGNTGYLATMMFTVDITNLCVTLKFLDNGKARFRNYQSKARLVEVVQPKRHTVSTLVGFRDYTMKIVRCSVCGGW